MTDRIDDTLKRLTARGGPRFHEIATRAGAVATIRRLLRLPTRTHYYERLDGRRVTLTAEEAGHVAPIELELFPRRTAIAIMRNRRRRERDVDGGDDS